MVDWELFLTILYVQVDDWIKTFPPPAPRPGPRPSLSPSEVVTLELFAQWARFRNERDFYTWARRNLRQAFPTLPSHPQFNRLARAHHDLIVRVFRHLADELTLATDLYEVIDTTPAPVRDHHRRGGGWLAGQADIGKSTRLGWFEGFRVITAVRPSGLITGFGFSAASVKDQPQATSFFAARCDQHERLLSVGAESGLAYLADKGFEGEAWHETWRQQLGCEVIVPPKRNLKRPWPESWMRVYASAREIVETANAKLHGMFRLERERPHTLSGFATRLAAKMALHNFCIWLNRQLGTPDLAFAELVAW